jgi:hypothetical protein
LERMKPIIMRSSCNTNIRMNRIGFSGDITSSRHSGKYVACSGFDPSIYECSRMPFHLSCVSLMVILYYLLGRILLCPLSYDVLRQPDHNPSRKRRIFVMLRHTETLLYLIRFPLYINLYPRRNTADPSESMVIRSLFF